MAKTIQELFHARSVRELFEGTPPRDEITIREAATAELELRPECQRSPLQDIVGALVPGNHAENHPWLERNKDFGRGQIQAMMEAAREGHRIAEEFPERGAYSGGPPIADQGGIMQEECSMKTIGPFVPVPPDEVRPPATGGAKMRIELFDDYIARQRGLREKAQGSPRTPGAASPTGPVIGTARGFPIVRGD